MLLTQVWQLSEVPLSSFFFQHVEKNAKIDFFPFFSLLPQICQPPFLFSSSFVWKDEGGGVYTVHVVKLSAREDEDNVLFSAHLFFSVFPTCRR